MLDSTYAEILSLKVSRSSQATIAKGIGRSTRLLIRSLKEEVKAVGSLGNHVRCRYGVLKSMKGLAHTKTCLVVGNGPSNSSINWDILKSEQDIDVYCINQFNVNKAIDTCDLAGLLLSDRCSLDIDLARRTNPEIVERVERLHKEVRRNQWPLFVPSELESLALELTKDSERIVCFNDTRSAFSHTLSPLWPRRHVSMTVLKLLSVVLYMGYDRVLLVGCDNDYTRSMRILPDNSVASVEGHSGGESYLFNSMPLGYETQESYLASIISLNQSWKMFSDSRILNLDPLSYVDAFEKVSPGSPELNLLTKQRQYEIKALYSHLFGKRP